MKHRIIEILLIVPSVVFQQQRTDFKRREFFKDVLCRRDYAERVVASFANQIQSECYGGNISVSIEGIALEHFSTAPQADISSSTLSRPRHAVFHPFLSDDSKQDAATNTVTRGKGVGRQLKVRSIIFLRFDVSSRVLNNISTI